MSPLLSPSTRPRSADLRSGGSAGSGRGSASRQPIRRATVFAVLIATLYPPVAAGGANLEPGPAGLDAKRLVRRAEAKLASDRTFFEASLRLRKSRMRGEQEIQFQSYRDHPRNRSFLRVLAPKSLAGTGLLLLHPNLWIYDPDEERLARTSATALQTPWQGSNFTLGDVLQGPGQIDSYHHRLLGIDPALSEAEPLRAYVVESVPKDAAPGSWPAVVTWIETERGIARRQEFRDGDGELLRVLEYGDVRDVQGRPVPHAWIARWPDQSSRESRIEIRALRFGADFDESVFTTGNLRPAP